MLKIKQDMSGKNFDIFISYRRSDGTEKARILDLAFSIDNCRTFLDVKSLGVSVFDKKLEAAVLDAPIFVMVLTPDYFKRCNDKEDWVRREIELALDNGKVIIPINYNGVLKGVPDYLDEEFRNRIGCHNFLDLYQGYTFYDSVKGIFEREIRPVIGAKQNTIGKVKVRFSTDADCELMEDDEFLATIQAGKSKEILLERGKYKITAHSTEFPDIEQLIKEEINELSYRYRFDIELANKVKQRKIAIAEKEKAEKEANEQKRKVEEARIAAEKAENERIEKEKQLAEQKRKAEQARLEAERKRQENLKKEKEARIQRKRERERQRKEALERRRIKRSKENEKESILYRRIGFGFLILCVLILIICVVTCGDFKGATETATETVSETAIMEVITPSDYDENRLPEIYSIEIRNESWQGNPITEYGEKIYSSKAMILRPQISYKSYADRDYKFYVKWIKPDGSIRRSNFSPAGYSQSKSCKLYYGEGTCELAGWGSKTKSNWKEGNYAIEIWCEGTLLKRKEFTIYKSR